MTQHLALEYPFPAAPAAIYQLWQDREFVAERLSVIDASTKELVTHQVSGDDITLVIGTTVSRGKLPRAVRGFVRGEPGTQRTETWSKDAEGYAGRTDVVLQGSPATVTGRMSLRPAEEGSVLTADVEISVHIPMFGAEIEKTLVGEITEQLDAEVAFTLQYLSQQGAVQ